MFGQAMATFVPPMLPGTVVFMRGYNPHEIVRQIKTRRISVLVSVPKILDVLRDHVAAACTARRTWRHARRQKASASRSDGGVTAPCTALFGLKFWAFVVGAAPLDPRSKRSGRELGFVVVQGYGLTETAPIVTLNHPFGTSKGSVGKPIAGVDVKIAPDGEILVRGDNVTTGYFNGDAETAQRHSKTAGFTQATSARWTKPAGSSSAAARKK